MALHGTNGGSAIVTVSTDGSYIVRVHGKEVSVHSAIPVEGSHFLRSIKLQEAFSSQLKFVKVSQSDSTADGNSGTRMQIEDESQLNLVSQRRLLCASSNRILVWQINSLEWHADIENIEPSVGTIEFGASDDEAILFHSWSSKVTIFNLESASSLIIKSPKFYNPSSMGHGYRPLTRQLAILLKPEASDLLTIHEACSYDTIAKVTLPTVDAQGLKWSPDGRWIAIWDAASNGTKVLVYTADGQLYRAYTGRSDIENTHDLGVKCIEWTPLKRRHSNSEILAVGKYDGTVDLLNTRTFSCSTTLSHTFSINDKSPPVWRERMSPDGKLEYAEAASSSAFVTPGSDSTIQLPKGVSSLQFSPHGELLATIEQTQPNIVWIWAMTATPTLETALVHEHNVKNITWHAKNQELLITTANNTLAVIHLWSKERPPVIAEIPIPRSEAGRYSVTWVKSTVPEESCLFWFNNTDDAVLGCVIVDDQTNTQGRASFNSLYMVSRSGLMGAPAETSGAN
ncbi:WD40 domain protein [Talaromyces stipitatus ATCC 10500]|uniref:WD40 domain protein n=1 Tax=Talaromyces stipitatus (strain ATCC 10500 / CBS 375.48 / QM 6759 / NRRL 1006) TaxID=441959 RepID=B8M0R4_TALSN|nr:WD40 domain protein [Talaromyces stipitatus ATCC 10500]EED21447.1 WD40 domain protein [Talaromyces stipitatus ATCC 10500]